ncbi:MAG: class 1 isoprenoid biosynthesis enzyme [Ignavibacteriales bacterium]|nr:class 1 isoprenoid biosynthesis enzyme [Ignavibacteriales bacterium]
MKIPSTLLLRRAFVAAQPGGVRKVFNSFFRRKSAGAQKRKSGSDYWLRLPYWRILPVALHRHPGMNRRRIPVPSGFLRDIQWAQYCLFLFIRFQDDVFDGQSADSAMIYASDQCLFEAERIFAKYFDRRSWFWREYRRSLILTTQSIVEVDALQCKSTSRPEDLLGGYVNVSSILKVGSAAVCAKLHQKSVYRRVSSFCNEMAKAGQLIDDLRDLNEDLVRNRHNYAAKVLSRSENRMLSSGGTDEIISGLRVLAASEQIYLEVHSHMKAASKAIGPLAIPEVNNYIEHHSSLVPTTMPSR